MSLHFSKYQGAGNDFIYLDDRVASFSIKDTIIKSLCHRKNGIGADGLVLLQSSLCADFLMRIFNADGSEAAMCGNAIRCLIQYIKDLGIPGDVFSIETLRGIISCQIRSGKVFVKLPTPLILERELQLQEYPFPIFVLDTGVSHAVCIVENLADYSVVTLGRMLRFHPYFAPHGLNVNFVQVDSAGVIHIRTYERGVEDEVLSCGTGAAAALVVLTLKQYPLRKPFTVLPLSKEPLVFTLQNVPQGQEIEMTGPVSCVFTGFFNQILF